MDPVRRLVRVAACVLACAAMFACCGRAGAAGRPNIVVILVDDMGFSDIGCYGGETRTPNIDRLAAGGVRFTQFYNTARCCPTRASLLTGLYPHQAGVGHMTDERRGADGEPLPGYSGRLNDRCATIAEALRPAGYFTAMTGKWHVGQNHGVTPWGRGFERNLTAAAGGFFFHDSSGGGALFYNGRNVGRTGNPLPPQWYTTDLWTDFGLKFVDEARAARKPFFLYLAHNAPHFPLQAPPEDVARWRGKFTAGWDRLRAARHKRQQEMGLVDKSWPLAPRPDHVPAWDSLTAEQKDRYDHIMAVYAAVVERMDRAVGALVEGLRERGELDNTLILFMSDNGGNAESGVNGRLEGGRPGDAKSTVFVGECWATLNNTPFVRYKHFTDEGGIATPLVAHWPAGIPAARRGALETQPGHLVDVMATCVDVAGAAYPKELGGKPVQPLEGVSLRPAFEGKDVGRKQPLYWEHEGNRAIRDGNWKLVALENKPWRLYDLAADRTEQRDLAAEQPHRVKELAAKWDAWAARANVLPLGGWRGFPPRRVTLKNREKLDRNGSPRVAGRGFTITARFDAKSPDGVLVAHGGTAHGYALFLKDGKLTFLVRARGKATAVATEKPVTGAHTAVARLDPAGALTLTLDGAPSAAGKVDGPMPANPVDGLSVGADEGGLVGPYGADNAFGGTIESVVVEVDPAPGK
jgi:arylsulfatase A-like enzyme